MPSVKERDHIRRLTSPAEVRELALLPTSWEAVKFIVTLVARGGGGGERRDFLFKKKAK